MILGARRSARRFAPAAALALCLRCGELQEDHEQVEIGGASLVAEFGERPRRPDGGIALQITLAGSLLDEQLQGQGFGFAADLLALR